MPKHRTYECVNYVGCFVDRKQIPSEAINLDKPIARPHVTLLYRPDDFNTKILGAEVDIEVIGYGKDDQNEGYLVRVHTDDPEVQKLLDEVEVPHITTAISEDGKAVNTRFLPFEECPSFRLKGKVGTFCNDKQVCYSKKALLNKEHELSL